MNLWDKVCAAEDLMPRLQQLARPLVMTNGVFDVLHRGHVEYLHRAAQEGASLLVALNSDVSARGLGKGADRPLNRAVDRATVLAGLAAVDVVTFFDAPTPVDLLRQVRPEVYVKGGDYDMATLEETRWVRSWGGQALALPFVPGYSTTSLLKRIRQSTKTLPTGGDKAVFLDRDGVINRDKAYVHRWEDFEFLPGVIEGLRLLKGAGYRLVVVSNQSGLARGLYSESAYQALTRKMQATLEQEGVKLDGIYHCPHHPQGGIPALSVSCDCRKPAPGMLLQAARELHLSLPDSVMLGDKITDVLAARAAGVGRAYGVLADTSDASAAAFEAVADRVFDGVLHLAKYLCNAP